MPPGVKHPTYLCWDDLSAEKQAKFLAYDQVAMHDANPPAPKTGPKPRRK